MLKIVSNKISQTVIPAVLIVFIFIAVGCSMSKRGYSKTLTDPPQKTTPEPENKEKYTYTLSPGKPADPDKYGYTRRESESFLCASVENYIRSEEVYQAGGKDTYFIKAKTIFKNQKKVAQNFEINKWFEDEVTVTSRGNVTVVDIETIKEFYEKINHITGEKKFVYKPGLKAANIVVELAPPDKSGSMEIDRYMGATSLLEDNLRVRLSILDTKIHIETYKAGSGVFKPDPGLVKLNPDEMEFRKNNRIVKVYIKTILDPVIRKRSIIHELLHTLGFTGHSPYYDSNLFPLPVRAYKGSLLRGIRKTRLITKLAERMVEILYRPEILPGMTIAEAAAVLPHLKSKEKTTKDELIAYLLNRTKVLEKKKKELAGQGQITYDRRMNLYIELDKLVNKQKYLLEELAEIKTDNKLDAKIVKEIEAAGSLVAKLTRIRREIILLENKKRKLAEETGSGKKPWKVQKQIDGWQEEIVVLKDISAVAREIAVKEREIENSRAFPVKNKIENKLRRVLRQLLCVNKELEKLKINLNE